MIASFLEHFAEVEDPRYEGFVRYPLPEIVLGALIGTICGAEDWEEVALFCEEKLEVLRRFLPYETGLLRQKHSGASSLFWTAKPLPPVSQLGSMA